MLETPPGYIPLKVALDLIQAKLGSAADAKLTIAEACYNGKLNAAFRTFDGGADELDRKAWHRIGWRRYFDNGTIDLELPLIDVRGRPSDDGRTAQGCTREVFIASGLLNAFLASLPVLPSVERPQAKRGPKAGVLERVAGEMHRDLLTGSITLESLRAETEKVLAERYQVSRDTVRKARSRAIVGAVSKPEGKSSANDK